MINGEGPVSCDDANALQSIRKQAEEAMRNKVETAAFHGHCINSYL